jgi:GNAT superfamily N-acetyltransferase
MAYRIRMATLDDIDVLIHHRIAMFSDMGRTVDVKPLSDEFRRWLTVNMPSGTYRAWLAEAEDGGVAAGGGATIIAWPPGPQYMGHSLAFVYNVYTEPAHRRRGLARQLMEAIHAWCRENDVSSLALNASRDGQPLYEAMGYAVTPSPMMFFSLAGV